MRDLGDGRLELDELGSVIDHASSLDTPTRDDVLEGNDATTWAERLESAGLTPWLRRHRVALAAVTVAVVVIGAAGTAWVRTRPPEQLRSVDVVLDDWVSDETQAAGVSSLGSGTFLASYRAQPRRAGASVRILGLVGPGVRASTAREQSGVRGVAGSSVADVAVVIGCDDPAVETATANDFRLRVEETDAYGRSTTGLVPLPPSTGGQWADSTVAPCVQQQLTDLVLPTALAISSRPSTRTVTVDVTLHNGYDHDLTVSPAMGQGSAVYVPAVLVVLGKGQEATVPVRLRVTDCSNPRLDDAYVPSADGTPSTPVAGLSLFATVSDLAPGYGASLVARFSPAQAALVTTLLGQICQGVPTTSATVVAAGTSPIDPAVEFTSNGDPSTVGLRMTVEIAAAAQHVELRDGLSPEDVENGALPTIRTVASGGRPGHPRLTVDWAVPCSNVSSPPVVQLVLTSGSRSWPVRVTLADTPLLAAYRVACPGLQAGDFTPMGWPES